DGGADDAAGVAGALAAGEEPGDRGALSTGGVAGDSDGGAAARLGAGEGRPLQEQAAEGAVELRQAPLQGVEQGGRKDQAEVGGDRAAGVAAGEAAGAGAAGEEVAHPLDRRPVRSAAE